ncbi:MAG: DUF1273 domain-containing protein [Clostridia bacterium]|nr:DUF1273 domain-containing protein [Clostridia bacterium]
MDNTKICCGFGHREIYQNITAPLAQAIETAIVVYGITTFYTGGMGEFDALFASAVRAAKVRHKQIKLVLVKPYFTKDLNTNREYYEVLFDDVFIPTEILGTHYKNAIIKRNRFMVEQADLIICFLSRDYGGVYTAVRYAKKKNKPIINLGKET